MIVIDIKADMKSAREGVAQISKGSEKAAAMAVKMRDAFLEAKAAADAMTSSMAGLTGAMRQVRGSLGHHVSPSGAGGSKAPPRLSPQAIVNQMGIQQALQHYGPMAQQGHLFASRVVNSAVSSQKAIQRAQGALNPQPQDPMAMILQAFMRTRFANVGGKMLGMPLGVDISKLLRAGQGSALSGLMGGVGGAGGAGMAGMAAVAAPALAVTAAFTALVSATKLTADSMNAMRQTLNESGGNAGQASILKGFGLDPRSTIESALNSELGRYELNKAGVSTIDRALTGGDYTADMVKFLDYARTLSSEELRRVSIRIGQPGLQDFGRLTETQQKEFIAMRQNGDFEEGAKSMARFNFELEKLKVSMTDAGSPLMKLVDFGTALIGVANGLTKAFEALPPPIKAMMSGLIGALDAIPGADPARETAKNTKRMADNLEKMYRDGLSGGGARANKAIPGRWQGTAKLDGYSTIDDVKLGLY